MKQTKPKINGVTQLTEEQEQMRMQVVDLEYKARWWEAQWKIRYYTLETEKLQPAYNDYLEAERVKREEFEKMLREQLEKNQEAGVAIEGLNHIITPEDVENNPTLPEQGVNIGDEIQIPEKTD